MQTFWVHTKEKHNKIHVLHRVQKSSFHSQRGELGDQGLNIVQTKNKHSDNSLRAQTVNKVSQKKLHCFLLQANVARHRWAGFKLQTPLLKVMRAVAKGIVPLAKWPVCMNSME